MRKHLSLLAAASLAAGSLTFMSGNHWLLADDTVGEKVDKAVDKTKDAAGRAVDKAKDAIGEADLKEGRALGRGTLPEGIQKTNKDDSEDIRGALANLTEAAFAKNSMGDVVDYFNDADRNRLRDSAKKAVDNRLTGRINQIKNDWKAKYNQDFDVPHKLAFGPEFKDFTIVQGEISNPALLSNWPVKNPSVSEPKGDRLDTNKQPGNRPGDRNLDKGRNVAIVNFPMSHGMPEFTVSMIHELPDNWKIDVPDNITGQQLHDSILNHLTMFGEMKDQWPADVNEAYRAAAHHLLLGVYNINPPYGGEAKDQQGRQ